MSNRLKMTFREYLSRMNDAQLKKRIGADGAKMLRDGILDTSRYIPPRKGERYSVDDLKADDIDSFGNRTELDN